MKSINMINIMSLFISVNAQIANAFTPLILYYRMTGGLSYNNPSCEYINTDNDNKRLRSVIICKSVDDNYECYMDDYLDSYPDNINKPCSDYYYEGYKDLIKYDKRYKDLWDEYYTGTVNKNEVNYEYKHIIENAIDETKKKEQKLNKVQKKIKKKQLKKEQLKKEQPKNEQSKKEQPKKWPPSSANEHPKNNVDDYPLLP